MLPRCVPVFPGNVTLRPSIRIGLSISISRWNKRPDYSASIGCHGTKNGKTTKSIRSPISASRFVLVVLGLQGSPKVGWRCALRASPPVWPLFLISLSERWEGPPLGRGTCRPLGPRAMPLLDGLEPSKIVLVIIQTPILGTVTGDSFPNHIRINDS